MTADGTGQLIPFPTRPGRPARTTAASRPGTEVESATEVLDGELLTDEENAAVASRTLQPVLGAARRIIARAVSPSDTESTALAVWRVTFAAGVTVTQGFGSWTRRAWDAASLGVHRRQIKAAEAMGDQALLAEWVDRKHQAHARRHKRLMDLPRLGKGLALATGGAVVAMVVAVLFIGLVVQVSDAGQFMDVVTGALVAIRWGAAVVVFAWAPLVILAPVVIVVAAWREGHRAGSTRWLATVRGADVDMTIDETTIANALAALRIPQITDYLKKGLPIQYLTTARLDGRGTHAVLRLPDGVTAERIARRRADLATGLHRLAKEVWPTTGSEAGVLDLWVADKGALAEGAGPYPLLTDGVCDVFKGVPFGKTLRGQPISAPIMERNTITGGIPGQGKSSSARVIMIGAALDPTAELRIWIPDSNFDFEAFRPRCSRYVMGDDAGKIAEILSHLRELHEEVQTRGELLVRYETPSVTRRWASEGVGLHPLICLLEEAHIAIQHAIYGEEISHLLIEIVRLGRKRGIHMIVSTQAPTAKSIPRDVTRNCSNGIAFAVGDHVANDALLGQGAYAGGHRATDLIPGTDIGTAVVKGFSGHRSEMVQAYFLDVAKGHDQVSPIIKRSLPATGDVPGASTMPSPAVTARDLLEDLDEALSAESVPAADIPALLAHLAPGWVPYRRMTGKSLRAELKILGVKVASTGNKWPVDPAAVRRALADRATADLDDGEGE